MTTIYEIVVCASALLLIVSMGIGGASFRRYAERDAALDRILSATPPTTKESLIASARNDYARGKIDIDEFECTIGWLLDPETETSR